MATYKETSYLAPVLRWGMAVFAAVLVTIGILAAIREDADDQWVTLMVTIIPATIAILLMFFMRLELRITSTEITHRMFPLEFRERKILLSDVASMEVQKLQWLGGFGGGYGGFGKRRKPWKKQISYIMNRKAALLVRLKDGKIRLFTTERENRLRNFVKAQLGHLNQNENIDEKIQDTY